MTGYCSFCGNRLQNKETSCSFCGKTQLSGDTSGQSGLTQSAPERPVSADIAKKKRGKKLFFVLGGILLLLAAALLVFFFLLIQHGKQEPMVYQTETEIKALLPGEEKPYSLTSLKMNPAAFLSRVALDDHKDQMLFSVSDEGMVTGSQLYYQDLRELSPDKETARLLTENLLLEEFQFSRDGKYVFYLEGDNTLYRYNIASQSVYEVSSEVEAFKLDKKSSRVYWWSFDRGLWFRDFLESGDDSPVKIAESCSEFTLSEDGKTVYFYGGDVNGNPSALGYYAYQAETGGSRCLFGEMNQIIKIFPDGTCYYQKEKTIHEPMADWIEDDMAVFDQKAKEGTDTLCFAKYSDTDWYGEFSEEIHTNPILEIQSATDQRIRFCYYDDPNSSGGGTIVEAEIQPDGTALQKQDFGEYGEVKTEFSLREEGVYMILHAETTVVREAQPEKEYEFFAVPTGDYTLSYDVFPPPEPDYEGRDSLRERISDAAFVRVQQDLFYFDGRDSVLVAENVIHTHPEDDLSGIPSLIYEVADESKQNKLNLSEFNMDGRLYEIYDEPDHYILNGIKQYKETIPCAAVRGKGYVLEEAEDYTTPFISEDGTAVYYLVEDSEDFSSTLYRVSLKNEKKGKPEKLYEDVYHFEVLEDGVWTYRNAAGGIGGDSVYSVDLYHDDDLIAGRIEPDFIAIQLGYYADSTVALRNGAQPGMAKTLIYFGKSKEEEIAEDVYYYTVLDNSCTVFMQHYDYDNGSGDLLIFDGEETKLIDHDVINLG